MKSKWFNILFVLLLLIVKCTAVWAQEEEKEKRDIFSITPAFAFAWYPYAHFYEEVSTDTFVDLSNYGMSVMMGLRLFDKVGANLNLKIDDPTFQKMVDFAGYLSAYYFMLKFDYHFFGGTVLWTGTTPNPIPGGYDFRNQWNNVSLLFRIDQLNIETFWLRAVLNEFLLIGTGSLTAIGVGYARYEMPLEYKLKTDSGLKYPGFGLVKGDAWGISILWDTLAYYMDRSPHRTWNPLQIFTRYIWVYLDWFHGFSIGNAETDAGAIEWMKSANGGVSVNDDIDNQGKRYSIIKANLGLQHTWNIGKKGRIGLAVGVELLEEVINAENNDIDIYFWSRHIGPAIRVSAYW